MPSPNDELLKHTANRMADLGADVAQNVASRRIRSEIKKYLPHFLWPLIPGEGGSVQHRVEHMAQKKATNMLMGAGCSVLFFLLFGVAICGVAGVVGAALWQSGAF